MLQSQLFCKTKKETSKDAEVISHKFLTKGDFIEHTISGVYRFLPLGLKVLDNIENIINVEMSNLGAQKLYLPALQNKNLWIETGRWNNIDPPLFKIKDRHQKETALGSTHEEEITDIVRRRVKSFQDLPLYLYQIQDKFRNEMRSTGGLLRTREFLMKDLYSFHASEKDLMNFYGKVKNSYFKIFKKCGLKAVCVEASSGTIGGEVSHEFMMLAPTGEDRIMLCKKCGCGANIEKVGEAKKCFKCKGDVSEFKSVEIGHIFNLGTKYSQTMGASFTDRDGTKKPIVMGCYGIGLPRLMATIVEVHHDEKGIIWPKEVSPFDVHLMRIENSLKINKLTEKIYQDLQRAGIEVLYDDRKEKSAGEKFADADLIGIQVRVVVSERTLAKKSCEIKKRGESRTTLVKIKKLLPFKYV